MGESITEGTVSKWLKAVGDKIEKDEPILEISTDKVDAEVPSPVGGKLLAINVNEGETVEVGSVVGLVGSEQSAVSGQQSSVGSQTSPVAAQKAVEQTAPATSASGGISTQNVSMPPEEIREIEETEGRSYDYGRPGAVAEARGENGGANGKSNGEMSLEDLRRTKSSPLVRNIAKEHNIDISRISGTGMSGRVTKKDIMSFIETGAALRPQDLLQKGSPSLPSPPSLPNVRNSVNPVNPANSLGDRIEPMSVMRKKIAEHMTFSKQTSAHVTSVYEIDMTNVAKFRAKNQSRISKPLRHETNFYAVYLSNRDKRFAKISGCQCTGFR